MSQAESKENLTTDELVRLDPNLAFGRFFADKDWMYKTCIGGVWYASSILMLFVHILIPVTFCLWAINTGYVLRVMRVKIEDRNAKLPDWNDIPDLFISGMSWIAVACGFLLLIASVGIFCFFLAVLLSNFNSLLDTLLYFTIGTIVGISILTLYLHLFCSVLMANFARQESMAAGFQYRKVFDRLKAEPGEFFCAWMLGIGLNIVAIVVPIMTIVGIFFLPSTLFASQLLAATLIAQVWSASEPLTSALSETET
ncbi:MAG: DUF4013 domain-containing protein [Candidatus Obscuribacterales bacterium]|nr:DUF4013 domain-containing protein [Candidatus Obscuribacterales bacterium]